MTYDFLPAVYRDLGPLTINGAGVDLLRNLTYFDGHALTRPLFVLAAWALLAIAAALRLGARRFARLSAAQLEFAPAVAAGL